MSGNSGFEIENGVLKKYIGNDQNVVIPDGVTSIGVYAFYGCGNVNSVTIPDSVTKICEGAFSHCSSITSITIPNSVTSISCTAFDHCNIKEVHCSSLASWLSMKKENWSSNPFNNATELVLDGMITREIVIPEGTKEIPYKAFEGCGKITSITIPNSVTIIGDDAFSYCSSLTCVTIPDGVTSIGRSAFSGCSSLTNITIPEGVTSIGRSAFSYCSSLTNITIPEGVTSIGNDAFSYCRSLTGIFIPDCVTSIGWSAFSGCSSLTNITIPEGVTSIGSGAFSHCNIKEVHCTSLASWLSMKKEDWSSNPFNNATELILDGVITHEILIPEGTTEIPCKAFKDCSKITGVTIPDSVTKIGNEAFSGCRSLTSVIIPESVKFVCDKAFDECTSIESITVKGAFTEFGDLLPGRIECVTITNRDFCELYLLKKLLFNLPSLKKIVLCNNTRIDSQMLSQALRKSIKPAIIMLDGLRSKAPLSTTLTEFENLQFNIEDLAYIILYQEHSSWRVWAHEKVVKLSKAEEADLNGHLIRIMQDDSTISDQAIQFAHEMMNARGQYQKQKKAAKGALSAEAAAIRKLALNQSSLSKLSTWAEKRNLPMDEIGKVRMANSEEIAPVEAVLFVLNKYMTQMPALPAYKYSTYKKEIKDLIISKEADEIAQKLDLSDLLSLISASVKTLLQGSKNNDHSVLIPYCRYAGSSAITLVIQAADELVHSNDETSRRLSIVVRSALLLSDTLPAVYYLNGHGLLNQYASRRAMTGPKIKKQIAAKEEESITRTRQFDIGSTIIEATLNNDLEFGLFDTAQGKPIQDLSALTGDRKKLDSCATAYADFKADMTDYLQHRTKLLRSMHATGKALDQKTWKHDFIENPVALLLTQLLLWQDETGATFAVTADGKPMLANDQLYQPSGPIRVAHVLEIAKTDIDVWQKWLVKNKRKLLFDQVWEPVIFWEKESVECRYDGAVITLEERSALIKALISRGISFMYSQKTYYWSEEFRGTVSDDPDVMCFGKHTKLPFTFDDLSKTVTLGKLETSDEPYSREMNVILLELDKATVSHQIRQDNDPALTDAVLSTFTAAQIKGFIDLAIDSNAVRCTAILLNYRNEHFPEFADMNEYTLDW